LSDFSLWFNTGFSHIADWKAYDHILFLIVLCGVFSFKQWKNLLISITAFTIGHSISLALSVLNVLKINVAFIEFLIPVTIVLVSFFNLKDSIKINSQMTKPTYWMTCFFGLIHGLGFSFVLKGMLGHEASIVAPLIAFNLGLELGQLIIVIGILIFSLALASVFKTKQSTWNKVISTSVFVIAFIIAIQRFIELVKN